MSDALAVISWWLTIQVLGFAVWPLAARWLRWLPDRGYMLSKPIGLLLVSYGLWLLATLGFIQNSTGGLIAVLIGLAVMSVVIYRRFQPPTSNFQFLTWLRDHRALVIAYEVLFVIALIGWALFRANNPDLGTTEKPMEFAFFNAINRSVQFPPLDPWLSGYAIAYYYFGYVMMSVMHKLTGVTAGTAYALSNAFWFALSAASAFGVVANLVLVAARRSHPVQNGAPSKDAASQSAAIVFGVIGAIMLVLMGNFEAALDVARVSDVASPQFFQQLDILDLNQPYTPPQAGQPRWPPRYWWWWRASRVVHDYPPNTVSPQLARVTGLPPAPNATNQELIDEFPQFSFLLGDMHPHVLALPFALLMMALALNLYVGALNGEITSLWWSRDGGSAPLWPLYALAVGGLSFLNTWDFPIYAFVLVSALTLGRWRAGRLNFLESIGDLVALGITGAVLYLPFYRAFTSQAAGIAPNLYNGTRFGQFFVMFGPFLIIGAMLGVTLILSAAREKRLRWPSFIGGSVGGGVGLIAALTVVMAMLSLLIMRVSKAANDLVQGKINEMAQAGISPTDHLLARLADPWVPLALGISLAAIVLVWRARCAKPEDRSVGERPDRAPDHSVVDFALLLYAVGLLLAFGVEFAFIIDGFGSRMNTVFKFYYQAWALWSVASAFALYYLLREADLKRLTRVSVTVVATGVIGLGLLYPLLAIPDKVEKVAPTLDALEYSGQFVPDEYAAARWLNETVSGTPVILEAPGDEYNPATSRISTWTGLPTVVGWSVHEWQWRGTFDIQGPRVDEVKQVYSTGNMDEAMATLKKYNVRYVVVGPNERRQFPSAALAKFDRGLTAAFQQGAVTVYEVP